MIAVLGPVFLPQIQKNSAMESTPLELVLKILQQAGASVSQHVFGAFVKGSRRLKAVSRALLNPPSALQELVDFASRYLQG